MKLTDILEPKFIDNLRKHVVFLTENPDLEFYIETYSDGDLSSKDVKHICGTSACSIGWAPMWAGVTTEDYIELPFDPAMVDGSLASIEFSYVNFCERVFGLDVPGDIGLNGEVWDYLFGEEWVSFDNSLAGARARIQFVLDCDDLAQLILPYNITQEEFEEEFEVEEYIDQIKPYLSTTEYNDLLEYNGLNY